MTWHIILLLNQQSERWIGAGLTLVHVTNIDGSHLFIIHLKSSLYASVFSIPFLARHWQICNLYMFVQQYATSGGKIDVFVIVHSRVGSPLMMSLPVAGVTFEMHFLGSISHSRVPQYMYIVCAVSSTFRPWQTYTDFSPFSPSF